MTALNSEAITPIIDQSLPFQQHEADKQVSQQRRLAVYEHVISLYEQGCSQTEIAAQLHMSRKRIREFLKGPPSPPVYKQHSTRLAPYKAYLKQRFAEDGRGNSLQLYREVCSQGYDGDDGFPVCAQDHTLFSLVISSVTKPGGELFRERKFCYIGEWVFPQKESRSLTD